MIKNYKKYKIKKIILYKMSHKTRSNKKYRNKKVDSSSSSSSEEDFMQSKNSCNRRCRPDDCHTPTVKTAICQRDCDPLLKLTDSTSLPSAATFSALSPCGDRVLSLISFFFGDASAVPIDFQLYDNDCGTLIPTETRLPRDATGFATNPSVLSSAAVSRDFKRSAAIYEYVDPDGNGLGYGFVDVFDPKNPSVNLLSFPIYVNGSPSSPTNTFVSGTANADYLGGISEDDKNVAVVLQTASYPESSGVVQVYNLVNGTFISEAPILGFSNGATIFDLCQSKQCEQNNKCKDKKSKCNRRRFVAVMSSVTDVLTAQTCTGLQFLSPALLYIFELKSTSLVEVDTVSISSGGNVMSIPRGICCPPETLIAISTAGVVPGQKELFTFSDPGRASLNGTSGGVTIYRFNGEKLRDVAFQPIELGSTNAVGFSANGKYLAVSFSTNVRAPFPICNLSNVEGLPTPYNTNNPPQVRFVFTGYFQVFRVVNQEDCSVCLYPVDIPRPTSVGLITLPFSANGRWLLIPGAAITRPSVPRNGLTPLTVIPLVGPVNNIQLYQLAYPDCCDPEDVSECIKQLACNSKKVCKKDRC
jgi:hypothetical protein